MQILRGLSKARTQFIYKQGKYLKGTFLVLRWVEGEGRWCIATSRSIGCHAKRNLAKRRIKAALARLDHPILPFDVIVSCHQRIQEMGFAQIIKELETLVKFI